MIVSDGGRGKRLCVLLVAIALAASMTFVLLFKKSVEGQGSFDATATVSRVVDDDTVEIPPAIGGIEDVRLIGVDTRPRRGTPGGRT
jgi:endonuclease YncB( thermonuclease family)